ncbi:MAG TPA: asparagine synthase (glutamine-hydrolyzing) [Thermoleophilaceae bacterium]|nr:asparagine synthase (glutamine-hydrolyzing) [Thermoleophilaceae bacterium]
MCGICGLAGTDPRGVPLEPHQLQAMTDAILHRGPDDDGHHLAPGVGLGMRRLSVIDVPGSSQPIANEDGTVWTVFNGEIYNFPELRRELEARGHRLETDGDTEVIVHLYEELGADFVKRLRGMFAIALWDERRRRLVLARDRMGVKPLYLAEGPNGLAFASEVKSLIAGGLVDPALDPIGAELFMAHGYVPGPRTLFAGVRKLMPASVLIWEDGRPVGETSYWDPHENAPDGVGRSWEEDQERLLELLRDATRMRMISDVPLGIMLSGGLDSSLLTALMAEASDRPVETFSIGFAEDADANELGEARRVATRLGTEHHELLTSASDHPELLDEGMWYLEEPIADLSFLGFFLLSELARRNVTVALSGQGADELLGGYRKHQIAWGAGMVARAPSPLRRALAGAGNRLPEGSTAARGLAAATARTPADRLLAMSRVVHPHERPQLFTDAFMQGDAESEIAAAIEQHAGSRRQSILGETLALDSRLALVDWMLLYFDKMSMAASLEVRVPFMDPEVVSFCSALPDSRRVWMTRRKELLKRASEGLVDRDIIRKKKRGFFRGALGTWLTIHRDTVFRDLLFDERTRARGLYRPEAVERLAAASGEQGIKASQRLFCLLMLEKWHRTFVDSDAPARRVARGEDLGLPARGPRPQPSTP